MSKIEIELIIETKLNNKLTKIRNRQKNRNNKD